jgi:hypothetical protein
MLDPITDKLLAGPSQMRLEDQPAGDSGCRVQKPRREFRSPTPANPPIPEHQKSDHKTLVI